jgi:hypothetical protein
MMLVLWRTERTFTETDIHRKRPAHIRQGRAARNSGSGPKALTSSRRLQRG